MELRGDFMVGKLFFIGVVIVLPLCFFFYACYKRRFIAFLLGVLAFVISQMVIRIPILNFIAKESSTFQLWNATKPILIILLLAVSAGIFEETARFVAMRFFLKKQTLHNGIVFGLGHGGIEALLLVGIPAITHPLLSSAPLFASGVERICAMTIHVCLSIIVLLGIKRNQFYYCGLTIVIHSLINFIIGYLARDQSLVFVEFTLVLLTAILGFITYQISRRKFNDEKMEIHSV